MPRSVRCCPNLFDVESKGLQHLQRGPETSKILQNLQRVRDNIKGSTALSKGPRHLQKVCGNYKGSATPSRGPQSYQRGCGIFKKVHRAFKGAAAHLKGLQQPKRCRTTFNVAVTATTLRGTLKVPRHIQRCRGILNAAMCKLKLSWLRLRCFANVEVPHNFKGAVATLKVSCKT